MGWIIAILVSGLGIGYFVGDAVLYPYLYGLMVSSLFLVPMWVVSSLVGGFIDALFGKRK